MNFALKLLLSLNEENYIINEYDQCLICHGIAVIPFKCKYCNAKYCKKCFESKMKMKLLCYCRETFRENFEKYSFPTSFKAIHYIDEIQNLNPKSYKQIKYEEAVIDQSRFFHLICL